MIVQLFHNDRNHIGEFLTQIRKSKIRQKKKRKEIKKRKKMVLYAALFSPASVSTTLGHCTTAGNGTSTEGKLVVASETVAV